MERRCVQVRDAVHHDLERNGNLLFHFFGGAAGPLRDDLDVVVGDVRIGFHRQIVKRNAAPDEQQHGRHHHQKAVVQREIDQRADHIIAVVRCLYCSRVLQNQRVAHHLLARLEPGRISCISCGSISPPITSTRRKFFPAGEINPVAVVKMQNRRGRHRRRDFLSRCRGKSP